MDTAGIAISQVVKRTGIKKDLIKAWRRRYEWPIPSTILEDGTWIFDEQTVLDLEVAGRLVRQGQRPASFLFNGKPTWPPVSQARRSPSLTAEAFAAVAQPATDEGREVRRRLEDALLHGDEPAISAIVAGLPRLKPSERAPAVLEVLAAAGRPLEMAGAAPAPAAPAAPVLAAGATAPAAPIPPAANVPAEEGGDKAGAELATAVRDRVRALGLSVTAAAAAIGVATPGLKRILDGASRPNSRTAGAYVAWLGQTGGEAAQAPRAAAPASRPTATVRPAAPSVPPATRTAWETILGEVESASGKDLSIAEDPLAQRVHALPPVDREVIAGVLAMLTEKRR
jgi:hypothetical protein